MKLADRSTGLSCSNTYIARCSSYTFNLVINIICLLPTGRIERNHNWKERFNELNCSDHNCLRITRMMKCFGEVGLEHYKFPFVQFVLTEIIENKELAGCFDSCVHFWCGVIRDDQKRKELDNYIIKNMSKLPWAKTGMYQFQNIFVYFHEYANDAK